MSMSMGKLKREFENLNLGEHLCCIYRNKEEQFSIIIPFMLTGLENNEKCIYIVDESTKEEIIRALKKFNINIEEYIRSGQFEFLTKEDAYLKDGYFDPDRMIELLRQTEQKAIEEGYRGLRATGEMTWVFTKLPGVEKLIEYEAKLNFFFPQSRCTAICQYNESRFTPEILLDIIHTHPKIILYDSVCENPYYVPPDESLARMNGKLSWEIYERVRDDVLERNRIKKELKESEGKFKILAEKSLAGIYLIQDGVLKYVNPRFAEIFGYEVHELIGKNPLELVYDEDRKKVEMNIKLRIEGKIFSVHQRFRGLRKNNEIIYLESYGSRIDFDDKPAIIGTLIDVTERERLEKIYESIVENTTDIIFIVDSENRYRFVNRAFAEILDYEPGEILGKYRPDFAAEGYKKRAEKQLDEILRHKKTIREEMEFVKKNGELIIVEHTLTPIVEEGKIKYIVGIARDITQRKRLEDELKESERKYRELFELMPDMVLILDLNGNILEVNSAAERMTGYSREELLKMNIRQIDIEEGDERVDERIKQLLERGFAEFEVKHRRKDGTVYDVDVHAKLIDYRGRKAIMAVDRDISERKKMVEELKKYERFYKNAQDMFFIIDKNGKFVDVNPKFAEMLGYDVNELIKHTSKKITYHEDLNRVKDFFARILNGESLRGEFRAVAKDGRILWFELVEWPVYDNGKVIEVEGIVRDITERKRLEEELKKSEEKYRLIVENSRDIIFAVNPNGIATYVSPSVERIMGYKSGELIGNSVFEYIHPEDLDSVKSEFFNVVSKKRQGKVVHRIKRQDGEWIFVESVGAPMFDEDGSFIGSVIVTRDVTERIELEQKLISSEAKHKETAELLQRIIDLAPIAITGWDKEYKINMWNKTAENMFGWKAEEVMGKDLFEIQVPEYEKENVRKAITEVMETGISNKNINEDITKDGKRLICEWYNMAVKDAEGNIIGGISLGIDLTERIKMEEELKRLNKLLVTINEISKLIVHEKDKEELLTKACMELAKLEDYYTVAICLVENDKIVPVAISRASLSLFLKILAECGLIRKASKRKLIFANSETACVKCRLKQKEFKQVLAIPMVVDGEVRGVIIIYLGVDKKLSKDEIELLQTLANDIAFGIKSIEVEEQRRKAFEQITKNIEQFAVLIDSIRNPLTVIVGLAEIKGDEISEISELIIQQVGRIEKIIKQLDEGWIESERVREFLKKSMK